MPEGSFILRNRYKIIFLGHFVTVPYAVSVLKRYSNFFLDGLGAVTRITQ